MANLYLDRVSSEHPIAAWGLDDGASFVTTITEVTRDVSNWPSVVGATASSAPTVSAPFQDSAITVLNASAQVSDPVITDESIKLTSATLFSSADMYEAVPLAASCYVYIPNPHYVSSIDIGSSTV